MLQIISYLKYYHTIRLYHKNLNGKNLRVVLNGLIWRLLVGLVVGEWRV